MKILIIGNLNTVFTFEYIKEVLMKNQYTNIVVLTSETEENTKKTVKDYCVYNDIEVFYAKKTKIKNKKRRLHPFLIVANILRYKKAKKFDVIHFHGVSNITFFIKFFISKKTLLILSYYGSDLLRSSKCQLKLQRCVLKRADHITLATYAMIEKFNQIYDNKYSKKITKAMYGTTQVEYFNRYRNTMSIDECKDIYGLPKDKITVYIGYNGYRAQNHLKIISTLTKMEDNIKNKIHLVCHCSYGLTNEYRNEIIAHLENSSICYSFITSYLVKEEMVYFRLACDIFLNLQKSDALSASMIESMDAGAIVIKGDWLIYKEIEEYETLLISVSTIEKLLNVIPEVINNIDNYKEKTIQNMGILNYLLSWKNQSKKWLSLYSSKIK